MKPTCKTDDQRNSILYIHNSKIV